MCAEVNAVWGEVFITLGALSTIALVVLGIVRLAQSGPGRADRDV